jgi:exopolysaccharide biosynthesis polyprenyl glycosylphosphotransferase
MAMNHSFSSAEDNLSQGLIPELTADLAVQSDCPTPIKPRTRRPRAEQITAAQILLCVDIFCMVLPATWDWSQVRGIAIAAAISCLLFWSGDLYRPRLQALFLDEFPSLLGRLLTATAIVATVSALRHPSSAVSMYLVSASAAIALTLLGRILVDMGIRFARRHRMVQHRSLIVGTGPLADRLTETLTSVPDYGLEVAGYLADRPAVGSPLDAKTYLGPIRSLRSKIDQVGAEMVLVCDRGFAEQELTTIVRQALWNDCDILMVPRLHDVSGKPLASDMIGSIPVVRISPSDRTGIAWKCKRIFDVVVSLIALLLLLPLLICCAVAVRLESGPGIFFTQTRLGRDGRPFQMVKFRTLRPIDEDEMRSQWSSDFNRHREESVQQRVTKVGRILRRTSMDELPQLWTILRGDMTIVGPRPEEPFCVEKFSEREPTYIYRHRVPAGLTGLAQVNGMRGDTSISERSNFDNYYIENWSLWLDVKVILRTFAEVLFGGNR